jgi:hypothetical protein
MTNITQYVVNDTDGDGVANYSDHFILTIVVTILGTILLDINADACQIFARAYLLDVCLPGEL